MAIPSPSKSLVGTTSFRGMESVFPTVNSKSSGFSTCVRTMFSPSSNPLSPASNTLVASSFE